MRENAGSFVRASGSGVSIGEECSVLWRIVLVGRACSALLPVVYCNVVLSDNGIGRWSGFVFPSSVAARA